VEHPVTELVTGLDLVEWQLRVAAGEELRLEQSAVDLDGHAVEARICAEDPGRGFLPTGGRVLLLEEPDGLDGTRVDSGLADGQVVGSSYDPMLAKVIAWGPDRATALRRLRAALARTTVLGVTTNAGYLRRLLADTDVVAGDLDTGLVERRPELTVTDPADDEAALVAAALARQLALLPGTGTDAWSDPFAQPTGWRVGGRPAWTRHQLRLPGGEPVTVAVRPTGDPREGSFEARLGEDGIAVTVRVRADGNRLTVSSDGLTRTFAHATDNSGAQPVEWLGRDGDSWAVHVHDPLADVAAGAGAHAGDSLTAPMPGTVTVVKAAVGERVTKGQPLLVLEAMKMEHVISAPHDGVLEQLRVSAGSTVAMDELLAVVSTEEAAA
jgi:acetyl-CoA/propionyl-CoA carboxylase biotin carboxyl carrier protein